MKIFILEDDNFQRTWLRKQVENIVQELGFPLSGIFETGKPEELLLEMDKPATHHLYFLDMEIKGEVRKGLEVAQKIREKDFYGSIVFVTTHAELAPVTFSYQVSALGYVVKDTPETEKIKYLKSSIKKAATQQMLQEDRAGFFNFKDKFSSISLPYKDILFFERIKGSHKIELHTFSRVIELSASLNEIENMGDDFFRTHQSIVVNLRNACYLDKKERLLHLKLGRPVEVARSKVKELDARLPNTAIE